MTVAQPRIIVLGGSGMLGTDLVSVAGQQGLEAKAMDLPEFDITDVAQLEETVSRADIIVNCAAYTNVEKAESENDLAYAVNAEAVGRLGQFAKAYDVYVLHISTDFVFDGRMAVPYVETDEPNPINTYGRTKLAGEQLLAKSGCRFCIMRVEWTYGAGGNNFVKKLVESAKAGKSLRVVDDQIGSPTATSEAAAAICKILKKENLPEGVFHFAAGGHVSRYEMAKFIFNKLGIAVDLSACKSSDYVTAAQRPLNSRFNCGKIEKLLGESIRPWQEPLEIFLE